MGRKFWNILLAGFVVYGIAYIGAYAWWACFGGMKAGGDFGAFWHAAQHALDGSVQAVYDTASLQQVIADRLKEWVYGFPYPPHFLLLIAPLGLLPYVPAFLLWMIAGVTLYAAVIYRTDEWRATPRGWLLAAFVVVSPFSLCNFASGQSDYVMAAIMVAGLTLLPRRPLLAGVIFGLLSFKPQLALLLPVMLIAGRQWGCMIMAALTAITLMLLATLWFGPDCWQIYHDYITLYTQALSAMSESILRLNASLYRTLIFNGVPPEVAAVAQLAAALYAIMCVWQARHAPQEIKNATLIAATFIAAPYIMLYDTPLAIVIVLLWWPLVLKRQETSLERFALLLLLCALPLALHWSHAPFVFVAMLLNLIALQRRAKSIRHPS